MAENRKNTDQFQLRLPPGMRDKLKELAAMEGRSLNTEIVERLGHSMEWPQISLPTDLRDAAVQMLPVGELEFLESDITLSAIRKVNTALRSHRLSQSNLVSLIEEAIENAPEDQRPKLRLELDKLLAMAGVRSTDF